MKPERELLDVMRRCSDEIKVLRSRIAYLQPKAEAYDNMASLISLLPRPSQGYEEDLAYALDRRIAELTQKDGAGVTSP